MRVCSILGLSAIHEPNWITPPGFSLFQLSSRMYYDYM